LGHRRSVDLDLFLADSFDEEMLLQRIQKLPNVSLVARSPQTLHLTIQGIRVSFLGYAYPLLFAPAAFWEVPVADPRDIACMKITAIAARGTRRDFIDDAEKDPMPHMLAPLEWNEVRKFFEREASSFR
jgi:hypothetical protein